MFKKILILVAVIFTVTNADAQMFKKGDLGVNLGIRLSSYNSSFLPGANASAEYGLFPLGNAGVISLGGNLDVAFGSGYVHTRPAVRAAYHLGFFDTGKFDLYGGLMSGFGLGYPTNYLFVNDFIGGRYMFKDNMGVYLEAGFASARHLRGGICFLF